MTVPGPGKLDLAKTNGVKADEQTAESEGEQKLIVKSRRAAKKKLNAKGKARVDPRSPHPRRRRAEHGAPANQADQGLGALKRVLRPHPRATASRVACGCVWGVRRKRGERIAEARRAGPRPPS